MDVAATCAGGGKCRLHWCFKCLLNRYGEAVKEVSHPPNHVILRDVMLTALVLKCLLNCYGKAVKELSNHPDHVILREIQCQLQWYVKYLLTRYGEAKKEVSICFVGMMIT